MATLKLYEKKSTDEYADAPTMKGLDYNQSTNSFEWLTQTRCGTCKKLKTALNKLNITEDDLHKQFLPGFVQYVAAL